jgi:hypothetical protein
MLWGCAEKRDIVGLRIMSKRKISVVKYLNVELDPTSPARMPEVSAPAWRRILFAMKNYSA